jgi:large subunit ribosomal protein L27Ae
MGKTEKDYEKPVSAIANMPELQLWSLVPAEKRDEYLSGNKKDTLPVLDLLPLGYSKVLGKGRIPEVPLVVRARWFSKEAERKITEAGGVVELVA